MFEKIKNIVKHLKCKHDYEYVSQHMIDTGMRKIITSKCKKCGKEKTEII